MSKLILWLSVIWLPFLMVYLLINETKFKKNIVLGVTLPQEARKDADVLKEIASFKKNAWTMIGILTAMAVLMYFFSDNNAFMTMWMTWLVFSIILPYVPYFISNTCLKTLKNEKGWVQEKRTIRVDTSVLKSQKWLSPWLFVPPVILCLVPLIFDRNMAVLYIIFALMCAGFWFGYRWLYRNKAEMVDENAGLTEVLTRIRRYNWGKMWLLISYGMAAYAIAACMSYRSVLVSVLLTVGITAVICFYAFRLEMKTRRLQEKLTADSGGDWYVDDDDHWIGGVFYYNPDDSRFIINQRIGLNSSVNLAHPGGKIMTVLLVLMLLGMPLLGGFLDIGMTKEITLTMDDNKVVCTSGMGNYSVSREDISEVRVLEELPSDLRRRFGTATDTLLEGSYASEEIGTARLNLDPRQGPFLLIRTADGDVYLFGTRDGSQVKEVASALKNQD